MRYMVWRVVVGVLLLVVGTAMIERSHGQQDHLTAREAAAPVPESTREASVIYLWLDDQVTRAVSYPFQYDQTVTPQRYADALAALPHMEFTGGNGANIFHFRRPIATIHSGELTVNYTDVMTISSLSSWEMTSFFTKFTSWYFVPGVRHIQWHANGEPVRAFAEMDPVQQPLRMERFYPFMCDPPVGELIQGWLSERAIRTIDDMTSYLNMREPRTYPPGSEPLLPMGMRIITASQPVDGVLTVDLPASFSLEQPVRLAGIVMCYAQFPDVDAVNFTFGGKLHNTPFMRTTLDRPIHVYDLILPYPPGMDGTGHPENPWFERTPASVTASPSGRYLLVPWRNLREGSTIWVYDTVTKKWTPYSGPCHHIQFQWLPDESGFVTGYMPNIGLNPDPQSVSWFDHYAVFDRTMLNGAEINRSVAELPHCVEWLLIPDGSGIVATTIDPQTRYYDGNTEVRCRVKVYEFSKAAWRDVFLSRWTWPDMRTGNHLAFRKRGRDWILSYHEFGPADSTAYWVNLTTGESALSREGDPLFAYSPDGAHVIASGQLFLAYRWPQNMLPFAEEKPIATLPGWGFWSPDSQRICCPILDDNGNGEIGFSIYDVSSNRISRTIRYTDPAAALRVEGWFGPHHLLTKENRSGRTEYYRYAIDGSTQEALFNVIDR